MKHRLIQSVLFAIVFALTLTAGCGKVATVGVEASGTVNGTLNVQISPASFMPFFTTQCEGYQTGQTCYNTDPAVCAACLSQMLYNELGLPQPSPSPSP